jgi:uncharacterized protein (DUF58 family)
VYPTPLLLLVIAVPALLSFGLLVDDTWLWALLVLDAAVVAVAGLDAVLTTMRARDVEVDVKTARTWSRGRPESIQVIIENRRNRAWRLLVVPDVPREVVCEESAESAWLPARGRLEVTFQARAVRRGRHSLHGAIIAAQSRLGLWRRRMVLGGEQIIHSYPDLRQLADYALLARTDRLSLIGVRSSRRIGGDTEFERLRDWHSDDEVNRIDWKATARRDQLTVRDYQINQSQGIVLMLDAGRMMASRAKTVHGDEVSLLDLAIEAALMLAYVAIKQNDRVGLIAYADGVVRWVPPEGGVRQLNRLIHAVHDLEPTLVESRHDEAFLHLRRHCRKRSLVSLFTNVLDDVNADLILRHCKGIVGRHLPLAVLLRDPDVHTVLRSAPTDDAGFWRSGAAAIIARWRVGVIERLQTAGALVVDADPDRITPDTISEYLRVKAKHLL